MVFVQREDYVLHSNGFLRIKIERIYYEFIGVFMTFDDDDIDIVVDVELNIFFYRRMEKK